MAHRRTGWSADERIARYEAKRDVMANAYDKARYVMTVQSANIGASIAAMEVIKNILNSHGIIGPMRVPYLNFARRILKLLDEGISGEALERAIKILKHSFKLMGLKEDVLEDVANAARGLPRAVGFYVQPKLS